MPLFLESRRLGGVFALIVRPVCCVQAVCNQSLAHSQGALAQRLSCLQ
jgi:hypothetical protein